MAIQGPDARILGAITTPKINTPFENLDALLDQQRRKQVVRADEVKIRAAEQETRELAALQQTLGTLEDLSPASIERVIKAAPVLGAKWAGDLMDQRKKALDALKSESEMEAAEAQRGLSLLGVAEQLGPDAWGDLAPVIAKYVPDLAGVLPQQFDPQRIGALRQAGLTAKEQLEADRAALNGLIKGEYGTLAAALANVTEPAERQERLTAWRQMGVPKRVLDLLASDPQAFEMTPDKRADNERLARTEQRQEATAQAAAEERAIDNKRADAQLAISQAQLGLSRQRLAAQQSEAGKPKPLTATAESNVINRLVTQWQSANKTGAELDRAINLMDAGLAAARRGDMAAGSQAVLITFQKVLDPGSVVRESEYARSAAGQALLARVQGAYERLAQGGAGVPLPELEKFARLAKEAAAAQKRSLPAVRERIGKTADRYNIPRELVLDAEAPPAAAGASPAAPAGGQFAVTAPNGKTYVFPTQAQADVFKKRAGIK